ncbi:Bifunctional inhibitor/plant lipid transfer protein/seed storage helical domain containing protein [Trema orientale]|uniref:Bifunctional inhibitor/plant lipid transfer protein/seed storage helical domain containing protein n=1 Tax=Trema orientale TaxID=63057 RepID=A0A2P5EN33_TREOI|nr:Bifunctional inhibitor/plant lipid transfer protein/seed storage helical domain containing protein [Trema orientale]
MKTTYVVALFVMLLVVLLGNAEVSEAKAQVSCSALELWACADAMISSKPTPPSALCCSELKQQTPCLCQYIKDLEQIVNSTNTKNVFSTCGVQFPTC